MPVVTIAITVSLGADNKTGSITATGDGGIMDDITLTAAQANKQVTFPFLITDLVAGALVFTSDVACVIKTNSTSAPGNTFNVPAKGAVIVPALAADVTSLYVTNSDSANAGTLYIRGVRDVTP